MGIIDPSYITRFQGEHYYLSNFFEHPFVHGGIRWRTAEAPYQASKTRDVDEQRAILRAATPGEAKRLGRRCTLRDDWEEVKEDVMLGVVRDKFADEPLRSRLLSTGVAILIEGNDWGDKFWGRVNGEGMNKLGQILMRVRAELELPW